MRDVSVAGCPGYVSVVLNEVRGVRLSRPRSEVTKVSRFNVGHQLPLLYPRHALSRFIEYHGPRHVTAIQGKKKKVNRKSSRWMLACWVTERS